MVCYELEGVETNLPPFSWVQFCIPSINRYSVIYMGQLADGRMHLGAGAEGFEKLMKLPNFAPWFRHAQVVKKTATAAGGRHGILGPIKEPVAGNVVVVGDAAAPIETWIQGAIASGYQGAKAILKELSGGNGYREYVDWIQKAYAVFVFPDHFKLKSAHFILAAICSDEEVDYIYSLFEGKIGHPAFKMIENPELIKDERPELYERLQKACEKLNRMSVNGWDWH